MPPVSIEIFRPGSHRAMSGELISYTEDDLRAIAASYDPQVHEAPACVGHPRTDAPAYAWASALRYADGALTAEVDQVDPAFAAAVMAGRYKKISPAFYRPDSPANPKPGTYYLRHIGFLGAQPPAVKGLKEVAFADAETGVVAFADYEALDMVSVLRALREYIIGKDGQEAADRVVPSWILDRMQAAAIQPKPDADDGLRPEYAEPPVDPALEAERQRLAADRAVLDAERAAFAEARAEATRAEAARFVESQIAAGRVVPAERAGLLAFMARISDAGTVAFAEGKSSAAADWFRGFVAALPQRVVFGEVAAPRDLIPSPGAGRYVAPPGAAVDPERLELHASALAYQEAHPGTDYIAAIQACQE